MVLFVLYAWATVRSSACAMEGCAHPGADGSTFGLGRMTEQAALAACPLVAGLQTQADASRQAVDHILSQAERTV
jgi:hypothetical protein